METTRDKIAEIIWDYGVRCYKDQGAPAPQTIVEQILSLPAEGWVVECNEGEEMDCSDCPNYKIGLATKFKCQHQLVTIGEVLGGKGMLL